MQSHWLLSQSCLVRVLRWNERWCQMRCEFVTAYCNTPGGLRRKQHNGRLPRKCLLATGLYVLHHHHHSNAFQLSNSTCSDGFLPGRATPLQQGSCRINAWHLQFEKRTGRKVIGRTSAGELLSVTVGNPGLDGQNSLVWYKEKTEFTGSRAVLKSLGFRFLGYDLLLSCSHPSLKVPLH